MNKLLVSASVFLVAVGVAAAAGPPDPPPHLHPSPSAVQPPTAPLGLAAETRVVAAEDQLRPLAEVLAGEIAPLTGLKLQVATGPGRAGDVVLRIDKDIRAGEEILVLRDRQPVR